MPTAHAQTVGKYLFLNCYCNVVNCWIRTFSMNYVQAGNGQYNILKGGTLRLTHALRVQI